MSITAVSAATVFSPFSTVFHTVSHGKKTVRKKTPLKNGENGKNGDHGNRNHLAL